MKLVLDGFWFEEHEQMKLMRRTRNVLDMEAERRLVQIHLLWSEEHFQLSAADPAAEPRLVLVQFWFRFRFWFWFSSGSGSGSA